MWLLIFSFLLVYLYLTTNSLWDLFIGASIMVLIICFLNDWNIEQLIAYIEKELKPFLEFINNKLAEGEINE